MRNGITCWEYDHWSVEEWAQRPIGPWPIRSLELSLPRAKWPGNFRSLELLHSRVYAPRNIRSMELLFVVNGARDRLLTSQSLTRWRHQGTLEF